MLYVLATTIGLEAKVMRLQQGGLQGNQRQLCTPLRIMGVPAVVFLCRDCIGLANH